MKIPRFDFYDVVRVVSTPATERDGSARMVGAILGVGRAEDGSFAYTVALDGSEIATDFVERELEPTGDRRTREDYYTGDSIRVRADGVVIPEESP